ncbi:putative autophagy-related protein 11 [Palaemon carinicauda]|uniref:putative autophagy-related protein 11 n=1 Tax=Palaemon carinicauda TaxID=392227 RepID=UPI0035B5B58D
MSVRHIDFVKIRPSKCLMVEIRPVRCYIETSSGMTKTAKWMSYEHWKELRILLNDITTSYEESKMIGLTEEIKCNEHKMKDGQLIKIGYMFVPHNSYKCQFLMPREDATWTDDEDEEIPALTDKGGKYRALIPCAERLVVSVRLQNQTSLHNNPADKQLFKALDSSFVVTNTISDYFPSSQKKFVDSEPSLLQSQHDEQNELKNMNRKHKQRTKFRQSDCNHRKKRLQKKSIFDSSSDESSDHKEELELRRLTQVQKPSCSDMSDLYPSFKGIDFSTTRYHRESLGFTKEEIENKKKSGTDALTDDAEINSLSDELQSLFNDTQSQIDEEFCDVKSEEQCIDDGMMEPAKTDQNDNLNSASDTEIYFFPSVSNDLKVPLSYSPEKEELSYEYDGVGLGCYYSSDYQRKVDEIAVDHIPVLNDEEDNMKRHFMHSNMNTYLNDGYLEKDLALSTEKDSNNKLNVSPIIGNRKSQPCEMVDSLTKTTLSSQCLLSNEVMNNLDGKSVSKTQNLKRTKRGKLKIVKQIKIEELPESKNQCESPQKNVGLCKNQPCNNSEILEGISENPGYSSIVEDKVSVKNASKNRKEKTAIKSKIDVSNAKPKLKTIDDIKKQRKNCKIHESEKIREGKKILREVMNDIEEMRKRKRDESPLSGDIFKSPVFDMSCDLKLTPGMKNKRNKRAGCKKIERPSCQPSMKDYLSKKSTVVAIEKKTKKDLSQNSKSTEEVESERAQKNFGLLRLLGGKKNKENGEARGKHTKKKLSIDMFIDSSEPSDSSIACYDGKLEENQSQSVKPCGNTHFSKEDGEGVIKNKLLPLVSFDVNSSQQDEGATSVYIDSNTSIFCLTDIKTPQNESFCADEGSDNMMVLDPHINHLRECKSKLTGVTVSELSERLNGAHEYLRGIINEEIFSEKHQSFKKNCNGCGNLLSIEVYAVFDEEQSEFVIDLMRKKYSEKLQSAIKDKNVRRQYIWKVLVPSFFIKLTMDILNITSEKQAQNQLMEICMNFAD